MESFPWDSMEYKSEASNLQHRRSYCSDTQTNRQTNRPIALPGSVKRWVITAIVTELGLRVETLLEDTQSCGRGWYVY